MQRIKDYLDIVIKFMVVLTLLSIFLLFININRKALNSRGIVINCDHSGSITLLNEEGFDETTATKETYPFEIIMR